MASEEAKTVYAGASGLCTMLDAGDRRHTAHRGLLPALALDKRSEE